MTYKPLPTGDSIYSPFQPLLTNAGLKRFGLSLQFRTANHPIRQLVHSYLQISTDKPTPYPMIPDGTVAIFISPQGAFIGGTQSQVSELYLPQAGDYFGIRFYPGMLRHFFHLNLADIADQFVDNEYIPCSEFSELHHQIYRYDHFHERAEICEQWLLKNYQPQDTHQIDHALAMIYQSSGNIKIEKISEILGWSSRHLNRLFHRHTGLSTKSFSQIIRQQQVCKQLFVSPKNALSIAHESGFFDQSHLINVTKKQLLTTPNVFLQRFMSDFSKS